MSEPSFWANLRPSPIPIHNPHASRLRSPPPRAATPRHGLTLLEVLVIVGIIVILIAILLPALGHKPRGGSRQIRCSSQVRGIIQGMVVWAGNNGDKYPLPSLIDLDNATVADQRQAKDTTANIYSLMIYNSISPVDMFISPAEVNPDINGMPNYQLTNPSTAKNPAKALWDPAFSADFSQGKAANNSYAHAWPFATATNSDGSPRLGLWNATFIATEVALGNRGPQTTSVAYDSSGLAKPTYTLGDQSNTFQIHGSRTKWEGNVGFNDNHVDFWINTTDAGLPYATTDPAAAKRQRDDVLFYDEPDAAGAIGANNGFLSIFTKAGPSKASFTSIWD